MSYTFTMSDKCEYATVYYNGSSVGVIEPKLRLDGKPNLGFRSWFHVQHSETSYMMECFKDWFEGYLAQKPI